MTNCKKCLHIWTYKGKSTYYACCPNCKTSVKLNKKKNPIIDFVTGKT